MQGFLSRNVGSALVHRYSNIMPPLLGFKSGIICTLMRVNQWTLLPHYDFCSLSQVALIPVGTAATTILLSHTLFLHFQLSAFHCVIHNSVILPFVWKRGKVLKVSTEDFMTLAECGNCHSKCELFWMTLITPTKKKNLNHITFFVLNNSSLLIPLGCHQLLSPMAKVLAHTSPKPKGMNESQCKVIVHIYTNSLFYSGT